MVVVTPNSHRGYPRSIHQRNQIYSSLLLQNWRVKAMGKGNHNVACRWRQLNLVEWEELGRPIYLVVDELRSCVLWSLMIGLGDPVDVFWNGEYGFTYRELMLFWGMGVEFKDKIMLYCFGKMKFKQGFTTGIWYYLYMIYNAYIILN